VAAMANDAVTVVTTTGSMLVMMIEREMGDEAMVEAADGMTAEIAAMDMAVKPVEGSISIETAV